jgi:hypothetical protein
VNTSRSADHPDPASPVAAADPAALWFGDCLRCGYSLEGLPTAGICPECGEAYDRYRLMLPAWGADAGGLGDGRPGKRAWMWSLLSLLWIVPNAYFAPHPLAGAAWLIFGVAVVVLPFFQRQSRPTRWPFVFAANERGACRLASQPAPRQSMAFVLPLVVVAIGTTLLVAPSWLGNPTRSGLRGTLIGMGFFSLAMWVAQIVMLRRQGRWWRSVMPGVVRGARDLAVPWEDADAEIVWRKGDWITVRFGRGGFFMPSRIRLVIEGDDALATRLKIRLGELRRPGESRAKSQWLADVTAPDRPDDA